MKEMKNWNFLMLANRLHFQVLPNTQRGWKLKLPNVDKKSSNGQKWMKVGSFEVKF